MEHGHRLRDRWYEACTLWNTMSRTALLFDCLWRSEPNPDRFENLREWVSIIHTDAKTKLKALELFVKFQQRKRQWSNGSQAPQFKTCNPALHAPTTREVVTYDASITGMTGRSMGQAMPDLCVEDVSNVPRGYKRHVVWVQNMTSKWGKTILCKQLDKTDGYQPSQNRISPDARETIPKLNRNRQ